MPEQKENLQKEEVKESPTELDLVKKQLEVLKTELATRQFKESLRDDATFRYELIVALTEIAEKLDAKA